MEYVAPSHPDAKMDDVTGYSEFQRSGEILSNTFERGETTGCCASGTCS